MISKCCVCESANGMKWVDTGMVRVKKEYLLTGVRVIADVDK